MVSERAQWMLLCQLRCSSGALVLFIFRRFYFSLNFSFNRIFDTFLTEHFKNLIMYFSRLLLILTPYRGLVLPEGFFFPSVSSEAGLHAESDLCH